MSQTGTTRRAARGFLLLGALLGCAQDQGGTGTQLSPGNKDAETPIEDRTADGCEERRAWFESFVESHRDCNVDADCTIIGSCSDADFRSIRSDAAEQGASHMARDCQNAQDGPTYNAVCRANKCDRVPSGLVCGQPAPSTCPAGTQRERPGCSVDPGDAPFVDGCYASCKAVGDDGPCPTGYTCQRTTRDPCIPAGPGLLTCDACGQHDATLCLPACDLHLAIALDDGRTEAVVSEGGSAEMTLWLENRSTRTLTLDFDVPCHGPAIQGLGSFDVWGSCLAGACPTDPVRTTLTLAAGEKLRWRSAVLADTPSACNPTGLPDGVHALSFTLAALEGAKVCGPATATLLSVAAD